MKSNPWFSAYLRDTRQYRGLSQQQVADAGGPYRQMQAAIENEERDEFPPGACAMYEQAYGWPANYATALAEIGEYAEHGQLDDVLRGDDSDAAAAPAYDGGPPPAWKSFGGFHDQKPLEARRYPIIGFSARDGSPVGFDGPMLTNVGMEHLCAMVRATSTAVIADVNVVDEDTVRYLRHFADVVSPGRGDEVSRPVYRTCPDDVHIGGGPLVIDPLSEMTNLEAAKRLVASLRAIRPQVETSTVRAAVTLLAVVAFGGDPLVTISALKRRAMGLVDPEFDRRFDEFWTQFCDPEKMGPDLAVPEYRVSDLLAGLLGARDDLLRVVLHGARGEQRPARFETPETVRPEQLFGSVSRSPIVFYDSTIAPEIPAALCSQWLTAAVAFHKVGLLPSHRLQAWPGGPFYRIGITEDRDARVVEQHHKEGPSTLTNFVNGQAIHCSSGRAQRIWIPTC